jgi:hypothetical protein
MLKEGLFMKNTIFWDMTPCYPFKVNQRFGVTYPLHLQDRRISRTRNQRESKWQEALCFDPEDAGDCLKKCGSLDASQPYGPSWPVTGIALPVPFTRCYIPQDITLHNHRF